LLANRNQNIEIMAKISAKLRNTLIDLQQLLLESVNEAKLSEYSLLERFGETTETVSTLDELTAIAQQSADLYTQISRLLLQISEMQPAITPAMLKLLTERVETIESRVPALSQSIKEIKSDWGLL
jgi:chaperonin cofactor prefoldin